MDENNCDFFDCFEPVGADVETYPEFVGKKMVKVANSLYTDIDKIIADIKEGRPFVMPDSLDALTLGPIEEAIEVRVQDEKHRLRFQLERVVAFETQFCSQPYEKVIGWLADVFKVMKRSAEEFVQECPFLIVHEGLVEVCDERKFLYEDYIYSKATMYLGMSKVYVCEARRSLREIDFVPEFEWAGGSFNGYTAEDAKISQFFDVRNTLCDYYPLHINKYWYERDYFRAATGHNYFGIVMTGNIVSRAVNTFCLHIRGEWEIVGIHSSVRFKVYFRFNRYKITIVAAVNADTSFFILLKSDGKFYQLGPLFIADRGDMYNIDELWAAPEGPAAECISSFEKGMRTLRFKTEACDADVLPEVICLIIMTQTKYVVTRRAQNKKMFPGMLDIGVFGYKYPYETKLSAAARECFEELGYFYDAEGAYQLFGLKPPNSRTYLHVMMCGDKTSLEELADCRKIAPCGGEVSEVLEMNFNDIMARVSEFTPESINVLKMLAIRTLEYGGIGKFIRLGDKEIFPTKLLKDNKQPKIWMRKLKKGYFTKIDGVNTRYYFDEMEKTGDGFDVLRRIRYLQSQRIVGKHIDTEKFRLIVGVRELLAFYDIQRTSVESASVETLVRVLVGANREQNDEVYLSTLYRVGELSKPNFIVELAKRNLAEVKAIVAQLLKDGYPRDRFFNSGINIVCGSNCTAALFGEMGI